MAFTKEQRKLLRLLLAKEICKRDLSGYRAGEMTFGFDVVKPLVDAGVIFEWDSVAVKKPLLSLNKPDNEVKKLLRGNTCKHSNVIISEHFLTFVEWSTYATKFHHPESDEASAESLSPRTVTFKCRVCGFERIYKLNQKRLPGKLREWIEHEQNYNSRREYLELPSPTTKKGGRAFTEHYDDDEYIARDAFGEPITE